MKIDYNQKFKDSLPIKKEKLLLHTCCAVCAAGVLGREFLIDNNKKKLSDYFDVILYFYNPNIDTECEYNKRATEVKKLVVAFNERPHTTVEKYKLVSTSNDCQFCIKHRLEKTADYARENNIKTFCTTLSVSPHKNASQINALGQEIAVAKKINFLQADFKKENGFLAANQISKKLNLYRQNYCGCGFDK